MDGASVFPAAVMEACVQGWDEMSWAGLSLAINSIEQFPLLSVLAGLHRGTCRRGRGVGCLLPGYRCAHVCAADASRRPVVLLTIYSQVWI